MLEIRGEGRFRGLGVEGWEWVSELPTPPKVLQCYNDQLPVVMAGLKVLKT